MYKPQLPSNIIHSYLIYAQNILIKITPLFIIQITNKVCKKEQFKQREFILL